MKTPRRSAGLLALTALPWLHTGCRVDEDYGELSAEVSVGSYQTSTCSTSVVIGLSKQIADEVACMYPNSLVKFEPSAKLQITSNAVLPYLHQGARDDLVAVSQGATVQINSALRTVVQQYLLYRWYQLGRCGITAAALPGRSNHESGRAVDVANYSGVIGAMGNRGWAHDVPGDPVHFDHQSSPDIRNRDVLGFQKLWNRNNPGDKISEDGDYGPQTEARVRSAPATGFAKGASCGRPTEGANVVMIDGPDKVAPGTRAHFSITVANTGTASWPATTKLVVAGGEASELYDPQSWTSPSVVGDIGAAVGAGKQGVLELDALAPSVTEEKGFFTELQLRDGTAMFGKITLALTVTPNGDDGTSGDGGDTTDDGNDGGCSAAGGAGWTALLIPALFVARRRRRD